MEPDELMVETPDGSLAYKPAARDHGGRTLKGKRTAAHEERAPALSSTVLGGRTAIRLCTINPRTTFADVGSTIERLEQL